MLAPNVEMIFPDVCTSLLFPTSLAHPVEVTMRFEMKAPEKRSGCASLTLRRVTNLGRCSIIGTNAMTLMVIQTLIRASAVANGCETW
jgi:hypothetical protein